MRIFNFKNCSVTMISLGCLSIIAIGIIAFMILKVGYIKMRSPANVSVSNGQKGTRNSHLTPKDKKIKLKIAIITDSENDWKYLKKALDEIKIMKITEVVHLGDVTSLGVEDNLRHAKGIMDESGLNVYAVPGDRDLWKFSGVEGFEKVFGNSYGVVNINNVTLLLIDNANEYEGIGEKQWDFIVNELPKTDFIFLQNPIYNDTSLLGFKGMGEFSDDVDFQRVQLLDLIRQSNTKAVFAGDRHVFGEYTDKSQIKLNHYVIGAITSRRSLQRPSFAILTVYTDNDYYVEKVSL